MNFDRMRELILDKAIRGQLVPQLPEDGIVDQIGDAPSEVPFDIPSSWRWVHLESVCDYIQRGKSPKYSDIQQIPVIAQKCNQWDGFQIEKAKFIDPETINKYKEERWLQDMDLLWNSTGLGTIGRAAIYEASLNPYVRAVADSHVTVIRVNKSHLNPMYLYAFIRSAAVQNVIESRSDGTTKQKELSTKTVKAFEIPLPPISEQNRIAAKIENAFAEIDRAEKAYEELQTLSKVLRGQILQEAIQGKLVPQLPEDGTVEQMGKAPSKVPFAIPSSWKWLSLNDIGTWQAGGTPSRTVSEYYENGTIPWLKTGDLTDGKITSVEEYITEKGLENSSAHLNPRGTVLVAMYGATIGKLGVLDIECATNQACCACKVNDELIYNWYLFYYLFSQKHGLISMGAGGAQPNISKTKIIKYPIPLPPLAEQKRIVAKVEQLLAHVDAMVS